VMVGLPELRLPGVIPRKISFGWDYNHSSPPFTSKRMPGPDSARILWMIRSCDRKSTPAHKGNPKTL